MQALSFGARFLRVSSVLNSGNTPHRIEDFDHGLTFTMTDMFELVSEFILVQGIGFSFVDATLKIVDFRPALSLRDGGIAHRACCVCCNSPPSSSRSSVRAWRLFLPLMFPGGHQPSSYQVKALALSTLTPCPN